HGCELERGQVQDFLAAAGVSLTGQYLEQIGRRVVGGLLGAAAGNLVGALARGATGAAFSFATTYALGHVAKRYYAGGRVMSAAMLREAYADMLNKAKALQAQYHPQIAQRAGGIDVKRLADLVR
ncbi:MAG TPA: GTPase, partial [Burkholderiaceae bacterium]|nr:GTPase [Burkholderiaceae bacterium]